MRFVYPALSYALIGALSPVLLLHPKLRHGLKRRLGLYPEGSPWPPSKGAGPRIWLHGASAGDLNALLPIMIEIRARAPDATLIVSAMTNSGYAIAGDRARKHAEAITYVPYDLPGATRRAVAAVRPDLLVLEYAEIWPNLIAAAHASKSAIAVTNGRFSEALLWRYRLLYGLIGNPLRMVDLFLMREAVEAERALQIGAIRERVVVTGNTKFDHVAKGADPARVEALRADLGIGREPIFVAGSTHEGEERAILLAYKAMRATASGLRLVLAPRYVERGGRLLALAHAEGLTAAARSQGPVPAGERPDVLVLDTIGELMAAYALATLVFVGGSFVRRGGQNILEPAAEGRPVLFGPHMMNFRDSVEVLLGRGGIQVPTPGRLEHVASELLARPDELARLGRMAREAVQKVRGASARNAEQLLSLLDRRRSA